MTISSTTRTAGPFVGNGTTASFAFAFKVFAASDVDVFQRATVSGVVTQLTFATDYTVTLNAEQNSNPGGTVTLTAGNLATGQTLLIVSGIDNTQTVDITNQSAFYPSVINDALDRSTAQIQQVNARANRALRFPDTEISFSGVIPTASARANQMLGFDSTGNVIAAGVFPTQIYYGGLAADPATRNDGTARQAGDLYFNTVSNVMKVYTGAAWSTVTSAVTDGDKGDITVSGGAATYTIDNGAVTLAKMANVATDTLIGRDTAGTGAPEALSVTGGIEFSGSGSIRTGAFTGDVTKSAGGTALTIAAGAVTSAKLDTNIAVSGTLSVGSTTSFTGAPSYAADPASANVLSRKSYVDSLTRIGATSLIHINATNTGIGFQTSGAFTWTGSQLRAPAGTTWTGVRVDGTTGTLQWRTVTDSSDTGSATVAYAIYSLVRTS